MKLVNRYRPWGTAQRGVGSRQRIALELGRLKYLNPELPLCRFFFAEPNSFALGCYLS